MACLPFDFVLVSEQGRTVMQNQDKAAQVSAASLHLLKSEWALLVLGLALTPTQSARLKGPLLCGPGPAHCQARTDSGLSAPHHGTLKRSTLPTISCVAFQESGRRFDRKNMS